MIVLLVLCLWSQEDQTPADEALNAMIVLRTGDMMSLIDFKIRSPDPYVFSMDHEGRLEFIKLDAVTQIRWIESTHDYAVTLETGEVLQGRIGTVTFSGKETTVPHRSVTINLRRIARIHIISGNKLRTCPACGYQDRSTFTFCPVCGAEMVVGPGDEDEEESKQPDPAHRYRLDPRNPGAGGGKTP